MLFFFIVSFSDFAYTFSEIKSPSTGQGSTLEHKPFVRSFSGCGMRFANKHVKDKHEKTGRHVYAYVSIFLTHNSIPSYVGFWDKHLSRQCHIISSYVGHYCFELQGDFEEADEQFPRPRGGHKRKYPTIEILVQRG